MFLSKYLRTIASSSGYLKKNSIVCQSASGKNLLTDTKLRVVDIAMAAGFGSLRRFNDAFQSKYHLTPGDIQRMSTTKRVRGAESLNLVTGRRTAGKRCCNFERARNSWN